MIDYKNASDEELREEIERVRNRIFIYQDNDKDTTELMEYSNRLVSESMRRSFQEMPPEVLFEKLESMIDPEDMERLQKEFEEKYLKGLPDMPLAKFEMLIEKLKFVRDECIENPDLIIFDDGIDIALEMSGALMDYYQPLERKYPEKFSHLKEKIFRKPIFDEYADSLNQTIECAENVLRMMMDNPYIQEAYDIYNLFIHYPSWLNELSNKEYYKLKGIE